MRKKVFILLILILFTMSIFSDNAKRFKNLSMSALTISRSLTYVDLGFFAGLGIMTNVFVDDVNLYNKMTERGRAKEGCEKIKYEPDIKGIEIKKKVVINFDYKSRGESLILNSFFKYKGVKYLVVDHRSMAGSSLILYKFYKNKIKKIKNLNLSYIKNINDTVYGVDFKKPDKVFVLDDNFRIVKTIELKKNLYMSTDFYRLGKDFVFKKERFYPNQPGFLSNEGKSFFFKGQGEGKSLFEGYIRNQLVFAKDSDSIYITFMFPDNTHYPVFVYKKSGECKKIIYGKIEDYPYIPRGNWFEKGAPEDYMEIVSISKIFCDLKRIFVIIHRKTYDKKGKVKKYIQILTKEGKFLGEKEINILGYPVFYDRETKTFFSVEEKDFTITEWVLNIKSK